MNRIRVAAAAIATTPLAREQNLARCVEAMAEARRRGATLLCLPELALSGYGCEDAFHAPFVQRGAVESLVALAAETSGMIVSVGLPFVFRRALYNVAAVCVDGRVVGLAAKKHLPGDGIHYEPRWFKPWPSGLVASAEVDGAQVPIGDLLFEVGGLRFGFEICEDAWVADRPGIDLARGAVDLVLNPSASHFAFGKSVIRERFVAEGSRAFLAAYVYANLVGNEAGRVIYDGDTLIAESGRIVARGPRLGYRPVYLSDAVVDVGRMRTEATRMVSYEPATQDPPGIVRVPFTHVEPVATAAVLAPPRFEGTKEEELTRAIALGLFGHLQKTRARGFVLSLSGGVDSTAVACLVRAMVAFAARELGLEGLRAALAHVPGMEAVADEGAVMRLLLTTMYQAAASSGEVTRSAARVVAEAVSAKHLELEVAPLVAGYVELVGAALGRELGWSTDDVALQNVQARVRAPSAWLVANVEGKLLFTTSNRSEAALGYATMDGDTAGGLAPLAGIDKAFLRRWLVWFETIGPAELGPIAVLRAVNEQRSTPELRPGAQASEDDLMPFPLLDRIERHLVRDRRSPAEALALLLEEVPDLDPRLARRYVLRFATLFAQNQWKRERYAPSFHLDDENLDPKTWFRFPILSNGLLGASSDAGLSEDEG